MVYNPSKKKKSEFTSDDDISNSSTFDYVKSGVNKKTTWTNIKNKFSDVYGLGIRFYDTDSALIADDLNIGDHAISKQGNYQLYEITNNAATVIDLTLSNGLTASNKGNVTPGLETYNVMRYGAVADNDGTGTNTDNSPAIQAAIDALEATGKPGVVIIPSGSYQCDSQLTIDTSLTTVIGYGALLEFTNLAVNGHCVVLTSEASGYAGGGYYTQINYMQGIRFKGREGASQGAFPTAGNEINCFKLERGASQILLGYLVTNCTMNNFTVAIALGDEAWGVSFEHCGFAFNQKNYFATKPLAASGAKILFDSCIFQNGQVCFDIENQQGSTYVINCNIEAMTEAFFYNNGGELFVTGCHIEQASGHTASRILWRDSAVNVGAKCYASFSNNLILIKSTRTEAAFELSGAINLDMSGGQLFTGTSTYTGSLFESDGTGLGVGTCSLMTVFLEKGPPPFGGVFDNLDPKFEINAIFTNTSEPNTISFEGAPAPLGSATSTSKNLQYYDEGDFTPTPVSLTTTGSPVYTGEYMRIGNTVFGTLTIDANGGTTASTAGTTRFTGLPYTIKTGTGTAASCVTDTSVDQGSSRVEGASIYPPTWVADGVKRYVTFQYTAET